MMERRLCWFVLLCMTACRADHGTLSGEITTLTGAPLAATVRVEGLRDVVRATAEGTYTLPLPLGRFLVKYEAPGYVAEHRQWELFAPSALRVERVCLAPWPPAPGLWAGERSALEPVPEATVSSDIHSFGATFSGYRSSWRVLETPTRWCAGQPLIHRQDTQAFSSQIRGFAVDATRVLWSQGAAAPQGLPLTITGHGAEVRSIKLRQAAGLVYLSITPGEDGDDPERGTGYLLEIEPCAPVGIAGEEIP